MTMRDKVDKAIAYIRSVAKVGERVWFSPTEIGKAVGGYGKHSSFGSPICKEMVKLGLAERNHKGHYKLLT